MEVSASFINGRPSSQVEKRVNVDGIEHVDFETIPFDKREYIFRRDDFRQSFIISRKRPFGCGNEFLIEKKLFDQLIKGYVSNSNA